MTPKFDIFKAPIVTAYNVRLLDVSQSDDGFELLAIDYEGTTHSLNGIFKFSDTSKSRNGQMGYLQSDMTVHGDDIVRGFRFSSYPDQSLRRVKELDQLDMLHGPDGEKENAFGWICDAQPDGFLAPADIIPGEGGAFLEDQTSEVTLRVPLEFLEECNRYNISPEEALTGFVADVIGAVSYKSCPRADGLQSNGSDERHYAETYMHRTYGHNLVDIGE